MLRVSTTHKSDNIRWDEFLTFFCRRGKLRETEKLIFQQSSAAKQLHENESEDEAAPNLLAVEDPEEMKARLAHELKKKVIEKQNKVPRHGKGKYDVTVP